jgi:4-aminobutyrate aminotransferase-like enzyme
VAQIKDGFTKTLETFFPVVTPRQLIVKQSSGSWVKDVSGLKYLDLAGGQFCSVLGHANKRVFRAIKSQFFKGVDTDTSTYSEAALGAVRDLRKIAPDISPRSILLSTGAEANEFALRYAKHISGKEGVLSFSQGYYGQTLGTAAYSMSRDRTKPVVSESYHFPAPSSPKPSYGGFDESESLSIAREIIRVHGGTIGVAIFEPIVSGGGMLIPSKAFFQELFRILKESKILTIVDEAQSGYARTGSWFHYQNLEIEPDFVTVAKAIGLGFPVSAVLVNSRTIPQLDFPMKHFSSHQNEPLAGSIVSAGIREIERGGILNRNIVRGLQIRNLILNISKESPSIAKPRGEGMLIGFDISEIKDGGNLELAMKRGARFVELCQRERLLIQTCNYGRTVRLLPMYTLRNREIEFLKKALTKAAIIFTTELKEGII